jgi:hypothetical protein
MSKCNHFYTDNDGNVQRCGKGMQAVTEVRGGTTFEVVRCTKGHFIREVSSKKK